MLAAVRQAGVEDNGDVRVRVHAAPGQDTEAARQAAAEIDPYDVFSIEFTTDPHPFSGVHWASADLWVYASYRSAAS